MTLRSALLLIAALTAVACTSAPERQSADSLCEFRARSQPSVMLYYDKTSQIYLGEIDPKVFAEDLSSVPSAVAKPRIATYHRDVRTDCRNPQTGAWYPCTKPIDVDLSQVEVIVRGYHMERVSRHAVALCNKHTLGLIPVEGDVKRLSAEFTCEIVAERYCPLR